jgi:hypothetical protein
MQDIYNYNRYLIQLQAWNARDVGHNVASTVRVLQNVWRTLHGAEVAYSSRIELLKVRQRATPNPKPARAK